MPPKASKKKSDYEMSKKTAKESPDLNDSEEDDQPSFAKGKKASKKGKSASFTPQGKTKSQVAEIEKPVDTDAELGKFDKLLDAFQSAKLPSEQEEGESASASAAKDPTAPLAPLDMSITAAIECDPWDAADGHVGLGLQHLATFVQIPGIQGQASEDENDEEATATAKLSEKDSYMIHCAQKVAASPYTVEAVKAAIAELGLSAQQATEYVANFVTAKTATLAADPCVAGSGEIVNSAATYTATKVGRLCPVHLGVANFRSTEEARQIAETWQEEVKRYTPKQNIEAIQHAVAKTLPKVDLAQKMAVKLYTQNAIYQTLNAHLRAGIPEPFLRTCELLQQGIEAVPLSEAVAGKCLYRGQAGLFGDYTPGRVVTWKAFTSTTTDPRVATSFGGSSVLFKITGIKPQYAASVKPLSQYPSEEEVLLTAGTKFKVVSKEKKKGGKTVVTLNFAGVDELSETIASIRSLSSGDGSKSISSTSSLPCPSCVVERTLTRTIESTNQQLCVQIDALFESEQFLTQLISSPDWLNQPMRTCGTAANDATWLYVACKNGWHRVAARLLGLGADVFPRIAMGSTCLHAASFYGRLECVHVLADHCALHLTSSTNCEVDRTRLARLLNTTNFYKKTALQESRSPQVRELLTHLQKQADAAAASGKKK